MWRQDAATTAARMAAIQSMKSIAILSLFILIFTGCSGKATQVRQNSNAADAPQRAEKLQTTTAHTTENQPAPMPGPNSGPNSKWTQSGDPIDTAKFDGMIAEAEKALKAKPSDEAVKKSAAQAYFDRGFALTEARQYAAALGDYRKALKIEPNHEESKKWIKVIINIYADLKRNFPKEGEEPPPLKVKK